MLLTEVRSGEAEVGSVILSICKARFIKELVGLSHAAAAAANQGRVPTIVFHRFLAWSQV